MKLLKLRDNDSGVLESVYKIVRESVDGSVGATVSSRLGDSVYRSVRCLVWDSMSSSVYYLVRDSILFSVYGSVRGSVRRWSIEETIWDSVREIP